MRKTFRPEFLNRLDETVVFDRLGKAEIRHIVDIQLVKFVERLSGRGVLLQVTDGAKELLAELGWDPQYGARPLKRAIQRKILDPLSMEILQGRFKEGDRIEVAEKAGDIVFNKR